MTGEVGLLEDLAVEEPKAADAPQPDPRVVTEVVRNDAVKMERPEGLPDELWDDERKDVHKTKLLDAYKMEAKRVRDLRATISKGLPKPPETVDAYNPQLPEEIAHMAPEGDPAIEVAKSAALASGLSVEQFNGFLEKYLTGIKEKGLASQEAPVRTPQQIEAEDKAWQAEERTKLGAAGELTLKKYTTLVTDAYKNGSLTKADLEAFKNAAYNADGVMFLEKFAALHSKLPSNGLSIPTDRAIADGGITKEQLDAMASDPRMSDPAFRAKRSEGYRQLEAQGRLRVF